MGKKEQYERNSKKLLEDKSINKANRDLFKKFFKQKEYKLKRINGHKDIDESSYKTLCTYIPYLRNVNLWFKNKDWGKLTKTDIKKVYDGLEDGKLKGINGNIITGKEDYYTKIFKGDDSIFSMVGKDKIAKEVMKYYSNKHRNEEVRFIEEKTFKQIVEVTIQPQQKLLLWLAWDLGENIFSLLELIKKDFVRKVNPDTNEPEYIVNFRPEILKRSRTPRSEITNYSETVMFLDLILGQQVNTGKKDKDAKPITREMEDNEKLFNFGHRQALKFLDRAVKIIGAKCIPRGEKPTWKDLRSSMTCHLLKEGWSSDEIKARLGHKPSSTTIDKYSNYLAIDKQKPKKKIYESQITNLKSELEEFKSREKLHTNRTERLTENLEKIEKFIPMLKAIESNKKIIRILNKELIK